MRLLYQFDVCKSKHLCYYQRMKKLLSLFMIIMLCAGVFAGCSFASKEPVSKTGFYFDTSVTITLYGAGKNDRIDECLERCAYYDELFDRFGDGSAAVLNKNGEISDCTDLLKLLKIVDETADDDLFTVKIAPFIDLWGFCTDAPKVPETGKIEALLSEFVDMTYTYEAESAAVALAGNAQLDFGGVAKGYVGDMLRSYLTDQNIQSGLLNLGASTMILFGNKPESGNYQIALQTPFGKDGEYEYIFSGSDCTLSSSGSYERFFVEDGVAYHSIIDPKTGLPAQTDLNSVTVIVKNLPDAGAKADIYSTEAFMLGKDEALHFIENLPDTEAILFDKNNQIYLTDGLQLKGNTISVK